MTYTAIAAVVASSRHDTPATGRRCFITETSAIIDIRWALLRRCTPLDDTPLDTTRHYEIIAYHARESCYAFLVTLRRFSRHAATAIAAITLRHIVKMKHYATWLT